MARVSIISATTDPVSGATTEFTVTGPFWLFADGFDPYAGDVFVERQDNAGTGYLNATNEKGPMTVGYAPNVAYFDLPAGTYRLNKPSTKSSASISYEEAV